MPKFDSHPFDPAPEVSNPALNGSADRLTAEAISLMKSGRSQHGHHLSSLRPWRSESRSR